MVLWGNKQDCEAAYQELLALLSELGLDISSKKLVPPTKVTTCLGIEIDCLNFTMSIPPEKLSEITHICKDWAVK